MNALSPRTIEKDRAGTLELIAAELARSSLFHLAFPQPLETLFETETRHARVWNIRLTVPLGLLAYFIFGAAGGGVLPGLGWSILAMTPLSLVMMWACGRMSARVREISVALCILCATMMPLVFMLVSHARLAPYAMQIVLLGSMFGNITMRLRFIYACVFSGVILLCVLLLVAVKTGWDPGAAQFELICVLIGTTYGLVANNQLERGERRGFLHTMLEVVQSQQLSIDKAKFSALSLVDPLTGLANRRAFDMRLNELFAGPPHGGAFALALIDVDHFKPYNDHYGHPAGDACLARVAQLLRVGAYRKQDMAARYGGEEFVILLTDCDAAQAARIAQTLCRTVEAAGILHEHRGDGGNCLTISVGVAASSAGMTPAELIAAADRNLYAAKHAGRNRVGAGDRQAG